MKNWFKQLNLTQGLQLSFAVSALLCVFVGIVGLYGWEQQRQEMSGAINRDFPIVQSAFQIEEQMNQLQYAVTALSNANDLSEHLQWRQTTQQFLDQLKQKMQELSEHIEPAQLAIVQQQYDTITVLSQNISQQLLLKEELNTALSKINWLHNDFQQEITALLQETAWQNSTKNNMTPYHQQQDLLLLHELTHYEEQILTELKHQISDNTLYSPTMLNNSLNYLALLIRNKAQQFHSPAAIETLLQIMQELLDTGLQSEQLPALLTKRTNLQEQKQQLLSQNETYFSQLHHHIRTQIGSSQKQLQLLQHIVNKNSHISGLVILLAMIVACLLVIGVNFFYIRLRLLKRFLLLTEAVDKLINGEENVPIAVYGNDELGRIAQLFRTFLSEMNKKNSELAERNHILTNEIQERIATQQRLEETQAELIQTAKLAVVGKTLTSISHEINQPLNAMNTYVFSAKRAVQKQEISAVQSYLDKVSHLIERTALIIKRLRNFSRQGTGNLQVIDLTECIENAWNLLESKHQPKQGKLVYPQHLPAVKGETVLFEQVLVNLFLNSLEACEQAPCIHIELLEHDMRQVRLLLTDNGKGWPLTEKLLQPFSSSKSVNLGIGLTISQSIMQQCGGDLHLASSLTKSAVIILTFQGVTHAQ